MYQTLLRDSSFFALLLRFDEDLAAEARQAGCASCGGRLHSARYRRKPRGGPEELAAACQVRQSFCCAHEGCRRRMTPPSLRFLGRKVYFGVWVLLLPALVDGPSPRRMSRIEEEFSVSRRTLLRWRRWWRETVSCSRFWQARRGDFSLQVAVERLPASLLEGFSPIAACAPRVMAVLRWLLPLAGGAGPAFERAR